MEGSECLRDIIVDSQKSGKEITADNFLNWKFLPTEPGEYKVVLKQKVCLSSFFLFLPI